MLTAKLAAILQRHPALRRAKIADGAKDDWTCLVDILSAGEKIIGFYHAAGHLKHAFDVAYGESSPKSRSQFGGWRYIFASRT